MNYQTLIPDLKIVNHWNKRDDSVPFAEKKINLV